MQACFGKYKLKRSSYSKFRSIRHRQEGVSFNNMYCQYPVCGASRAIFYVWPIPKNQPILGNSHKTFKETNPKLSPTSLSWRVLIQNGYYSARISKIFHLGVPGELEQGSAGADMPMCWDYTYNVTGPELYSPGEHANYTPYQNHHGGSFYTVIVPDELEATQADAMSTTQAIAFLENRSAANAFPKPPIKLASNPTLPSFWHSALVRPHVPLVAPKRWFDHYPLSEITLPERPKDDLKDLPKSALKKIKHSQMNLEQQRNTIRAYYASVSYLDEQVGRVLNAWTDSSFATTPSLFLCLTTVTT